MTRYYFYSASTGTKHVTGLIEVTGVRPVPDTYKHLIEALEKEHGKGCSILSFNAVA